MSISVRPRHITPRAYLRRQRTSDGPVVVCLGDSMTRGDLGGNWVNLLRARYAHRSYTFVNAGINGDLTWNVRKRVDQVVACRPDVVTLLVGGNDVIASHDAHTYRQYRWQKRIPCVPTIEWSVEIVSEIITRLQAETSARIALLDIAFLGEDLTSEINRQVSEYNEALRKVAAQHGVPVLPLHDALVDLLPGDHRAPLYEVSTKPMMTAAAGHYLLRRPWDDIGRARGLAATVDHVHLSDRAAARAAELVAGFIEQE
jgi:lysophospholipase L1-like esterase